MPVTGAIIAGGTQLVGAGIGAIAASKKRKAQEAAMKKALAEYAGITAPTAEQMSIALEQLQSQGEFTPESLETFQVGDTELSKITKDAELKKAQKAALSSMLDQGQTGLSAEDRLALTQTRSKIAGDAQAQQQAILQNMQQRGMGGSGNELAARLSASQASANDASAQGDRLMAQAMRGRLDALARSGELAGSMDRQDFSQQEAMLSAQDRINQMRATNSQDVARYNVGARNVASADNLADKRRVADRNVAIRNEQTAHNKQLLQNEFNNKRSLASDRSNLLTGQATYQGQRADAALGLGAGLGAAVGGGIGAAFAAKKPATSGAAEEVKAKLPWDLGVSSGGSGGKYSFD